MAMTVIIGENDVGKTSCMLAVKTLFESKKLEEDSEFFMGNRERTVILEAVFTCRSPTEEQAAFVSSTGDLRVRCSYSFDQARVVEVKSRVPTDARFQNIDCLLLYST